MNRMPLNSTLNLFVYVSATLPCYNLRPYEAEIWVDRRCIAFRLYKLHIAKQNYLSRKRFNYP